MQQETLSLAHQELLSSRFRALALNISEYSFANLYLFRHLHQYELLLIEQEYFIKGVSRDQHTFLMPTIRLTADSFSHIQQVLPSVDYLFPIPEEWLSSFTKEHPHISFNENESDYLFTRSKLSDYPGRHLNGKRNLIRQVLSTYQIESYPLTLDVNADALAILDVWQEQQDSSFSTDYSSCREALEKIEELQLEGQIIYLDKQPKGFILGEYLHPSCFAVHFTKACKTAKGLYQFCYQNLAKSLPSTCQWINLEQDLGIPNIRQAKLSYLPDVRLHKFRLTF